MSVFRLEPRKRLYSALVCVCRADVLVRQIGSLFFGAVVASVCLVASVAAVSQKLATKLIEKILEVALLVILRNVVGILL